MTRFFACAAAAAAWWTQQVLNPKFQMVAPGGPEDKPEYQTTQMLGLILSEQTPVQPGQDEEFHYALQAQIEMQMLQMRTRREQSDLDRPDWPISVNIGVDYHPDGTLSAAAKQVGISTNRFPWKTRMSVYEDHVVASCGYGSPSALIWSAEGYQRPPCLSQQYADGGYHIRLPYQCSKPSWHEGDGDREHAYTIATPLCKHCGWPADIFHDRPEGGLRKMDHTFEAGALTACVVCQMTKHDIETREDRRTECAVWDEVRCAHVPTGKSHDIQEVAETALPDAVDA